jgi:hypothetical protein
MQADLGIADGKHVKGGERLVCPTFKSARMSLNAVVAGLKMAFDPAHYDPAQLVERLTMRVANPVRARCSLDLRMAWSSQPPPPTAASREPAC